MADKSQQVVQGEFKPKNHGKETIRVYKGHIAVTGTVAKMILDGIAQQVCCIEGKVVNDTYKKIWDGMDGYIGLRQFGALEAADNSHLLPPISPAEVIRAVQKMARTPDGVKRAALLGWDWKGNKLANLFNSFICNGKQS